MSEVKITDERIAKGALLLARTVLNIDAMDDDVTEEEFYIAYACMINVSVTLIEMVVNKYFQDNPDTTLSTDEIVNKLASLPFNRTRH